MAVQLGRGSIEPLTTIPANLNGRKLVWTPPPAALNDTAIDSFFDTLMGRVQASQGITGRIIKVPDNSQRQTDALCPGNFASLSECFVVILFTGVDQANLVLVSGPRIPLRHAMPTQ